VTTISIRNSASHAIIGIDSGGTFTDVTMLDPSTGQIWNTKTPSTPEDPSLGFGDGLGKVLALADMDSSKVGRVLHGTTVATNLILENKGPTTAMIVTEGFKYVLEIGRQDIPRSENLHSWVKPKRPVSPRNIFEIKGRISSDGDVLEELDEDALRVASDIIASRGIDSVALIFLNSYVNPAHECRAAEILTQRQPQLNISLSSEVLPVFREYERSMVTSLNSYVMSNVSNYVALLEKRVASRGISAPLLLMKSSGGVASARSIYQRPVETALSGPAAGIVGANFVGEIVGMRDLICIDIGGTSADISLIKNGSPSLTNRGRIGTWPIGLPMVDVTTIGAGGGSIARVSDMGMLTVGPESAGAQPGPVCYRRGGENPCVTDAHLVLGHLPAFLLDGSFELDLEGARRAIETKVARPLGLSIEEAARGILEIADNNMIGAIRIVSVERGFDPRDFVLVPFGGAGPLHGGSLARLMGIKEMLIPPSPGVLSALGLLVSDLKAEFSRTFVQRADGFDLPILERDYADLEAQAAEWFEAEKIPEPSRQLRRVINLRYKNQGFELTVEWSGDAIDQAAFDRTILAFHDLHERLYSFSQMDVPVEITNLRIDAIGTFEKPQLPEAPTTGVLANAVAGSVSMVLDDGTRIDALVYDRKKLARDMVIDGPCVVTQLDTTVYILPGQQATVHKSGSLLIKDLLIC
jgi:N-methylhydantoinase A